MRKFNNANEEAEHILKILGKEPEFVDAELKNNIAHYVFYNKKHNFGVCSKCGSWFTLDQMIEATNDEYSMFGNQVPKIERGAGAFFCPECYEQLQAIPYGHGRGARSYGCRANYWVKKGKTLYLIVKLVEVDFNSDKVNFQKSPRDIYIYGKDGPRRLHNSWGKWLECKSFAYKFENGMGYCESRYGYDISCNYPDELLKGSYLDYAYDEDGYLFDLKDTMACNQGTDFSPAWIDCEYLATFQRFPAVEVLHKTGFDNLIEERIRGSSPLSVLNWKAVKLQKIFRGLNMKEIREIRENKYSLLIIKQYQAAKKKGMNVSVTAVARTINYRTATLDKFIERVKDNNPEKCLKYLDENAVNAIEYLDYIRQCEELQLDLDDKKIRYPRIFIIAHATASEAVAELRKKQEEERNREKIEQFKERIDAAFPDGYEWHGDGLIIRPALLPSELRQEGNAMHHCVARYDDHVIRGDSFIIFIRQETEPDKSFVTMEVSQDFKRMYQIRAKANRDPAEEVRKTAAMWLAEYRKNYKKLMKGKETA